MLNTKKALSGAGPIPESVRESTQLALIKPKGKLRAGTDTPSAEAKSGSHKRAATRTKK